LATSRDIESEGSGERPSIVVTSVPATFETCTWHENARLPSNMRPGGAAEAYVAAKLRADDLSFSRITHSTGVTEGASTPADAPFAVN
jgi:hypothetical protein